MCPRPGGRMWRELINCRRQVVAKRRACGRRFVLTPRKRPVTAGTRALVEALLRERLALRAVRRARGHLAGRVGLALRAADWAIRWFFPFLHRRTDGEARA